MKTYPYIIILLYLFNLNHSDSYAQKPVNSHSLYNLPVLTPGENYSIALNKMNLKRNNYSVLVKARLTDDPIFHTIPGHFPDGASFDFLLKVGHCRAETDTLFITYRQGEKSVRLEEVVVYFFHQKERLFSRRPQRYFTRYVLGIYYTPSTRRGAIRDKSKQTNFPYKTSVFLLNVNSIKMNESDYQ